jgi:membrane fusion protein (multidrug efflux system)
VSEEPLQPSPSPAPSRVIPLVIGAVVAAVVALGGVMVWRAESRVNHVALSSTAKPVTVVTARAATFRASRTYVGTLRPWVEAKVGPQFVSAYVDTVLVRPGLAVKRGDVLATLDCRNASALNRSVAAEARAVQAMQEALQHEAQRMTQLEDGGFVSPNEIEQKTADSASKQSQYVSLQAQMLETGLKVSDCILRAPFDGEVGERTEDPGAFVRPGMQIVTVVDRSVIRVTGDAPEVDFGAVAEGTPARIHSEATGQDLTASVARRAPTADAEMRTVHFEIDIPDPGRRLPVNTTAEIGIDVGVPQPATEVPLYAAAIRGSKAALFVVEGDIAHRRTLDVEGESGGDLYLSTALKPGSQVVTEGRALLEEGDRVLASQSPDPAPSETEITVNHR